MSYIAPGRQKRRFATLERPKREQGRKPVLIPLSLSHCFIEPKRFFRLTPYRSVSLRTLWQTMSSPRAIYGRKRRSIDPRVSIRRNNCSYIIQIFEMPGLRPGSPSERARYITALRLIVRSSQTLLSLSLAQLFFALAAARSALAPSAIVSHSPLAQFGSPTPLS